MKYYIASCMFTSRYPQLSRKIQNYITERGDIEIIRCCTPSWKVKFYEGKMPEGELRDAWKALPHMKNFSPEDEIWSICHNCTNIAEEYFHVENVHSIWELIDGDGQFVFPDYSGLKVTVQDCWRSKDRPKEQAAVRSLLSKMNIEYIENEKNHLETDFCGATLYMTELPRNPKLAPKHYAQNIEGLFQPHTEEEQKRIMEEYCSRYKTDTVVCYCHYCLDGLKMGNVDGRHIAQMLFDGE